MRADNTPLAFGDLTGTTTKGIVRRHSSIAKTDRMPDPYPKVCKILGLKRFEELMIICLIIHDIQEKRGYDAFEELVSSKNADAIHLSEYRARLTHAIEQSLNQGILRDRDQITPFHILAAEHVALESGLLPSMTLMELPPIHEIDGRSAFEKGTNAIMAEKDHYGILERF